ncbi:GntR family transcriptional regulator [Neobacillus sp. D3-1R]|uniref:GntR family transcriptional regulator n=1 Tax=Neobacillus sp. D3-1R TaxID=3445778 RepID=UPI003FA1760D
MINKELPIPIYFQLEQGIKELIEKQELKPGELIPSEREFSETYQISRMTVRQAITNLVNEGILVRERGKGTFVAFRKIEQRLKGLTSFTENMKARGMQPSTKVLDFFVRGADSQVSHLLEVEEGALVYEIIRVRYADGTPIALESLYMPKALVPDLMMDQAEESIYEYVGNQLNLEISRGIQELEASISTKEEAGILGIKEGAPVLRIQRIGYLADGTALELAQSVYRGDLYKYTIELER